jgi:hypothetical protein
MGDAPGETQPWSNYLPALNRAVLAIEQALMASTVSPTWTSEQRGQALKLLEQIRQRWQRQTDPRAELDQLRTLCWDSPVASLTLVRTNLELISSWHEELHAAQMNLK